MKRERERKYKECERRNKWTNTNKEIVERKKAVVARILP